MTGLRDDELDITRLRSASMNRWKTPLVVQPQSHAPQQPTDREASQRTKPPKPSLELDPNDQNAHNFTVKRCRETSQSIREPTPPLNHRQRTPDFARRCVLMLELLVLLMPVAMQERSTVVSCCTDYCRASEIMSQWDPRFLGLALLSLCVVMF